MISGQSRLFAVLVCVVFGVDLTVGQVPTVTCPKGYFGPPKCFGICHCLSGAAVCLSENGSCTDGLCTYGWTGPPTCQTACPNNYFGKDCAFQCHCPVNDTCDKLNGQCSSNECLYGWASAACQQRLPVLLNPPDVLRTTQTGITVAWEQWISNQTGIGEGVVVQYVLQQVDNITNTWQNVTTVNASSSDPANFTYTVENLASNKSYKYRVQLIIDASKKPFPSIPGPTSLKWIHTEVAVPDMNFTDKPTSKPPDLTEMSTSKPPGFTNGSSLSPITSATPDILTSTANTSKTSDILTSTANTSKTPEVVPTTVSTTEIAPFPGQSISLVIVFRDAKSITLKVEPFPAHQVELIRPCKVNVEQVDSISTNVSPSFSVCLANGIIKTDHLLESTQYNISTYVLVNGTRTMVSIVMFTAPPFPQVLRNPVVHDVTEKSFKVRPQTESSKRSTVVANLHLVVVEALLDNNKSDFESYADNSLLTVSDRRAAKPPNELLLNVLDANSNNFTFYVAGILDPKIEEFLVGDGKFYTADKKKYYNIPLESNHSYMVWYVWQNSLDGLIQRAVSEHAGPVLTASGVTSPGPDEPHSGLGAGIIALIVMAVFLLLIILILIIILALRRKKSDKSEKTQVAVSDVEIHHSPYRYADSPYRYADTSFDNRNLAVSYLNSQLLQKSAQKEFDSISGTESDYVIPDPVIFYGDRPDRSCPIPIQRLRDFCSDSKHGVEEQFRLLPSCFTDSADTATLCCNAVCNRSPQVVPYDRNRVKLKHLASQSSLYVNASFVRTIGRRHCIVTQCPMLSTLGQFWQMVWERGTTTIVVLMNSEAPDSLNFDCYWPEMAGRCHSYGSILVELVSIDSYANYTVRHFKIGEKNASRKRHIFQWQYVSWVKGGLPDHHIPFLGFVKRIREERKSDSGFIVHCRTGGGRSGLYVAVDTLLTQGLNEKFVDVLRLVTLLRTERCNLVKTFEQYCFVYKCLCEEFDHESTRFLAEKFAMKFEQLELSKEGQAALNNEHEMMIQAPIFSDFLVRRTTVRGFPFTEVSIANSDATKKAVDTEAFNFHILSTFVQHNIFVVFRCLSQTYQDEFWHNVIDNRVKCLIMLNKMSDLPHSKLLLPQMGHSIETSYFTVFCKLVKKQAAAACTAHNLKVWKRDFGDETRVHNVRLFEFTEWPLYDAVPSAPALLDFWEHVRQWLITYSAGRPVGVFSCSGNSNDRSCLLAVLWYVLEQSQMEGVLDIFSAFRLVRSYLTNVLNEKEQYIFIYLATRDYLRRGLDHYSLRTDQKDRSSSGRNLYGLRTSLPSSNEPTKRRRSSPVKIPRDSSKGSGSASQHPDTPKDPEPRRDSENVEGKQEVKLDVLTLKTTASQLTVHGFQTRNISPVVEDAMSLPPRKSSQGQGQKSDAPTEPRPADSGTCSRRISASKERIRASKGTLDRPQQNRVRSQASGVRPSVDDGEEDGAKHLEETNARVDWDNAGTRQNQTSHGVELDLSKSSECASSRKKPGTVRHRISPADKNSGKDAQNKREPKDNIEQSHSQNINFNA